MVAIRRSLLAALLVCGLVRQTLGADSSGTFASSNQPTVEIAGWELVIEGNQMMPAPQLLTAAHAELESFRTQGQAASAIDDAAFQMELALRHAGYPAALVDYGLSPATRQVVFKVHEGQRLMLSDLVFQGNQAVSRERLLALDDAIKQAVARKQPFPYVAETVDSLLGGIQALYLAAGYLQVTAQAIVPATDDGPDVPPPLNLLIVIQEGPCFTVGEVTINGDIPPDLSPKIKAIQGAMQGKVYQRRQKLVLKTQLRDCYENAGYADAEITVTEASTEQQAVVRLIASVDSGQPVVVQGIQVSGNERTATDFIKSRLMLTPGHQYRLDDKRDSFSQLYQTGLFSSVELRLVEGQGPGQQAVQVEVEERKAREVYLEPGWGSYELLRLKSGYKDSNLLGSGKILRFDSALSSMGRSLEIGVSDPWFLGSDITVGLPFHYRYRTEPAFTMETSGADLYMLKTIHKKVTVNLGYQYSKNVVTDISTDVDLQGLATNYNTASLSGQLTRDTRDDMFFPTSGYRGNVALASARPEFGGTISYNRLLTGVRYFYPLAGGAVIGLRFNTGLILPSGGQQSIPVAERFFNGGESSVRSFQTSKLGPVDANGDPLGGTAFSTYNVEWRQKFTDDLAWSLFCDLGNISPNRPRADGQSPLALDANTLIQATWQDYLSDFRSGIGAGLQYMLPVGPARLDLAFNPDRDVNRNEPDYVLHFSIGMAF